MYVIGLTGNIATGKSTVTDMLARLGACVLDADKLAHEVMLPGKEAYRQIVARFGKAILKPDGEINRQALGTIVFADTAALRDLEAIVHPVVVEESLRWLQACGKPVAVIEAIKLLEANMHRYCDAIWVVTSTREQQVNRLVTTRSLTTEQAALRIDAQPDPQEKTARADVIIDNSGSLEATRAQVLRAWSAIPGVPPATTIPKAEGDSRP